jgi:hypothetical protein
MVMVVEKVSTIQSWFFTQTVVKCLNAAKYLGREKNLSEAMT